MEILVDFEKFDRVEEFHEYISKKLGFPDYYGNNLDALNDEISSLSGVKFRVVKGGHIDEDIQKTIESILCQNQ